MRNAPGICLIIQVTAEAPADGIPDEDLQSIALTVAEQEQVPQDFVLNSDDGFMHLVIDAGEQVQHVFRGLTIFYHGVVLFNSGQGSASHAVLNYRIHRRLGQNSQVDVDRPN